MKDEILIQELAEIRALQVTNVFMMQTLLESLGCNPEVLLRNIDAMNTELANHYEAAMRQGCGMEPREQPRTPGLQKFEEMEMMKSAVWDKMPTQ